MQKIDAAVQQRHNRRKTEDRIAKLMALRGQGSEQIVIRHSNEKPQTSFVPHVSGPKIRWHRLGIYY